MTDEVYEIFTRRLATPGTWVFPSSKIDGPRTTLQKAHEQAIKGQRNKQGQYEGGCGVQCRIYDFRHTFATRFATAGGSLPVLARILGHADLSLLMRYVHPSQVDMDGAMDWYNSATKTQTLPDLEQMLFDLDGQQSEGVVRPPLGPPSGSKVVQNDRNRTNSREGRSQIK
jgi:hypothetical protein